MIFIIDKNKIDFIQVDINQKNDVFIVSNIIDKDNDGLYQYFKGFSIYNKFCEVNDAQWHYKTGEENISTYRKFYSDIFKHWKYFVFDIPKIDEELELYLKLKYCS